MSYDIDIKAPACHACGRGEESVFDWNYTSNMSEAWRHAGADLAEFHGKLAAECAEILGAALVRMEADLVAYRKFDAPNGWGSMDTLLPQLRLLHDALRDAPTGSTVSVHR